MLIGKAATIWMPPQAAEGAAAVDWLFYFILWVSVVLFVGIVACMAYFCWKYRRRPGHEAELTTTHNTPLELAWSIPPLFLVLYMFWVGFVDFQDMAVPPDDAYTIKVTATTWSWRFEYPEGRISDELKVPLGRNVKLLMTSTGSPAVLHSLFIPAFRVKMDVLPGRYTTVWFKATKPGKYPLYCTEYCGASETTGHWAMKAEVEVVEDYFFEAFASYNPLDDEALSLEEKGRLVAQANGCYACHSVDGSPGDAPTWKGLFGSQRQLVGKDPVAANEAYIARSILTPQVDIALDPSGGQYGVVMPSSYKHLDTPSPKLGIKGVDAITAYIQSLKSE